MFVWNNVKSVVFLLPLFHLTQGTLLNSEAEDSAADPSSASFASAGAISSATSALGGAKSVLTKALSKSKTSIQEATGQQQPQEKCCGLSRGDSLLGELRDFIIKI
jgi:hypothetical protein